MKIFICLSVIVRGYQVALRCYQGKNLTKMEIGFTTGSALVIMYLESNNPKIENLTR